MKVVRFISGIILSLALLCCISFAIRLSLEGDRLGMLSEPIRDFSNLPRTAYFALNQISSPERFVKVDNSINAINKLENEIKLLGTRFEEGKWVIYLRDLTSGKTFHEWQLLENNFKYTDRVFSHADPRTPILMEDSSIIVNVDESMNLFRLTKESEIIWENHNHHFHHSINQALDGNVWTCSKKLRELANGKGKLISFYDDYITKVDANDGTTVYNQSVYEIFIENSLSHLIHGFNNNSIAGGTDPFHLNDIEEVAVTNRFFKRGDLIISLRNRSMILIYRPSSSELVRIIQGPFYNQHDVDLINDSTIRFFNNNVTSLETTNGDVSSDETTVTSLNVHAEVLDYHLQDSSFTKVYQSLFKEQEVYTLTQGLQETLANGDLLVESQNAGLIYVFSKEGVLFKDYLHQEVNGLVEPPHWVRVIE